MVRIEQLAINFPPRAVAARYPEQVIWRYAILVGLLFGVACNSTTSSKGAAPAARPPSQVLPEARALPDELKSLKIAEADPREARLAAGIKALLEREHVRPHTLDDTISNKAFASYIQRLDPGKLMLLKQHVAVLERDASNLDDQVRAGDFRMARTGAALLAQQRQKVSVIIAELLQKPFDFTRDESLETDPKKLEYVASDAELKDRWRLTLKQQVLERLDSMEESAKAVAKLAEDKEAKQDPKAVLDPPPATFEGREAKAREELSKSYAGRFLRLQKQEPLETAEMFINAFASVFDPHTLYLAPEQQENFNIQISGSLEGIGAVLSEDDHFIAVREVVPGGAAWRQGELEAGDLIMAVKQAQGEAVAVADMRINEVVSMIRGPKGSVVTLNVKKPDERVKLIQITRDVVVVEEAYARGAMLDLGPNHAPVGYIYLPSFYGNTRASKGQTPERDATSDVRALLERFATKKVGGVVLDLRGNGGGLLNHATGITGLLVDRGPVVAARNAAGQMQVLGDNDAGVSFAGQVVVLVDRFSASAAEILAGALQDYGRALIVGTGPTHGKGTVQAIVDLDRMIGGGAAEPLGVVKLTIQQFFLVDGESTQWRGVQPDVVLPDPMAHVESGERYLDNAIPWSQVSALPATPWPHAEWTSAALTETSRERQAKQPAFAKIKARGDYLLKRREQTVLPLQHEAWLAQREKDRELLETMDPKLDEGPDRFEVKLVDYRPSVPSDSERTRKASGERIDRWQESLSHDPWLEEALWLLSDMGTTRPQAKTGLASHNKPANH